MKANARRCEIEGERKTAITKGKQSAGEEEREMKED